MPPDEAFDHPACLARGLSPAAFFRRIGGPSTAFVRKVSTRTTAQTAPDHAAATDTSFAIRLLAAMVCKGDFKGGVAHRDLTLS